MVAGPNGKTLTYSYDTAKRREALVDPDGGRTTYAYDGTSRLTSLVNPFGERTTWAYDAVGQVKTLTYGNTARATYTYDSTARTTGVRHTKADGTLLAGYEYSYNNAGIPTGVVEGNGDRVTWSYDSVYRLAREQRSGTNAYDLTYTWDGAGNRLTKLASGATTTYTYNAGDALTVENAAGTLTTYSYDSAGNTSTENAAGSVTTYTWDDENRMTGILLPSGGGTWTMAYNPSGLRREKQAAGTTTRFVWDTVGALLAAPSSASRLLQETDADNATTAHYTAGLGMYGPTVSQRRSSTSSFLHGSLLGTIETLTAADQSVSDTYILDAWGREVASSGSTVNPHRYIGHLGYYTGPSLSLNYVRARWLRPATGSWLSVDPVRRGQRYAYGKAYPAASADPSGAQPSDFRIVPIDMRHGVIDDAKPDDPDYGATTPTGPGDLDIGIGDLSTPTCAPSCCNGYGLGAAAVVVVAGMPVCMYGAGRAVAKGSELVVHVQRLLNRLGTELTGHVLVHVTCETAVLTVAVVVAPTFADRMCCSPEELAAGQRCPR